MSCDCASPDGSNLWLSEDGLHLDVRGLSEPQPADEILGLIDRGEAGNVLIVHLDQEPIVLYPELDDRGWAHEIVSAHCDDPAATTMCGSSLSDSRHERGRGLRWQGMCGCLTKAKYVLRY